VTRALDAEPFWDRHYEDDGGTRVRHRDTLCVLDGERLVAAAGVHWLERGATAAAGLKPEWAAAEELVILDWIVAEADHPRVAPYVVDRLVERAAAARCGVRGNGRYRFGIGWDGVSDTWPHLTAAFAGAGFAASQRWTTYSIATHTSLRPTPPDGFTTRWDVNDVRHEWELRAFCTAKGADVQPVLAGECQVWDVPDGARSAGRHPWTTVEWIGVEEPYRQRGLGTYLLQEQRRVQATRGVKQVLLWTEEDVPDSADALRLYRRLGFQRGPTLIGYERPFS
jgi:ribosomal protein S18 acetylase RimI-like enzyme